jgi:glycosyltransferase involved in cell wall biosynthesis
MEKPEIPRNPPKISVIIPAYNQAIYLSEAIQSVFEQTYHNFELIVVDDGSTDETPQILAGIQDSRMRVIRQPNAGLSAARNTGLHESSAPLVTFLDADDYFLPDKLEVLSNYLEVHREIGLAVGGVRYIDESGNKLFESTKTPTRLALPEMLFENPICVSGILLRRKWLDIVGVFDERLRACEDWDLWIRLACAGCRFAWVEYIVIAYRCHQGQMTREPERMRKALFAVLDKFFTQPDLPENIRVYKKKAYASALIHAAAFAYHCSQFHKGQVDLAEAVSLDPTLKENQYKRLVEALVGWSNDPRSTEPADFLQRIISNPPPGQPGLSRQLRRAMADVYLGSLFSSSRENWRTHRGDLFKAILYKPDWLLNRGVLRIIADAWLHI